MAFLNSVSDKPFRVKAPPTSASALGIMAATLTDLRVRRGHPEKGLLSPLDLGPNLSVTGSLATSLWLTALRPEGRRRNWDIPETRNHHHASSTGDDAAVDGTYAVTVRM